MSTASRAIPAAAALVVATVLALAVTFAVQWLQSQSVLLASGAVAMGVTASVVVPVYGYAVVRIVRSMLGARRVTFVQA